MIFFVVCFFAQPLPVWYSQSKEKNLSIAQSFLWSLNLSKSPLGKCKFFPAPCPFLTFCGSKCLRPFRFNNWQAGSSGSIVFLSITLNVKLDRGARS